MVSVIVNKDTSVGLLVKPHESGCHSEEAERPRNPSALDSSEAIASGFLAALGMTAPATSHPDPRHRPHRVDPRLSQMIGSVVGGDLLRRRDGEQVEHRVI